MRQKYTVAAGGIKIIAYFFKWLNTNIPSYKTKLYNTCWGQ